MKNIRALLWASLIIAIIVAFQELFWLATTGLAWVIMGLAVAIGLQAVYLSGKWQILSEKIWTIRAFEIKLWHIAVLAIGIVILINGIVMLSGQDTPRFRPPTLRPGN